jgi:hypothetical protein
MTIKTSTRVPGEFIISEGEGTISRDTVTLKSGEKVADGTILVLSAGKAKAMTTLDISTEEIGAFAGIVIGAHDASATGTNGDIKGVPVLSRLAEINESLLTLPTLSAPQLANVVAALKTHLLITR